MKNYSRWWCRGAGGDQDISHEEKNCNTEDAAEVRINHVDMC